MKPLRAIDLNCDLGEYSSHQNSNLDELIMPYISSCNIACGFHSGDALTMARTIQIAKENQVAIGAHPSFPDSQGFGRRHMDMKPSDIKATVMYQVSALKGMVEGEGLTLHHVKPHGALYNACAKDRTYATAVLDAVQQVDKTLIIYGLADSLFAQLAESRDIPFRHEVFIDRAYEDDLQLRSRHGDGALLTHEEALIQLDLFLADQSVKTVSGLIKPLTMNTICIHSDTPDALVIVKSIFSHLLSSNIEITADR